MTINEDYNKYTFGEYIRRRREELGYSCRQLAVLLEMSPIYLSDIERGCRKAPITTTSKGKNYMVNFIKQLHICEEDIISFYAMAEATRNISSDIVDYLNESKYAKIALRLAKEVDLSDDEWKAFTAHIMESYHIIKTE